MSATTHTRSAAPVFDTQAATELARCLYGVDATATDLPSYIDRNFLLTEDSGARSVLKIANPDEGIPLLDMQNKALSWLAKNGYDMCPIAMKTTEDLDIAEAEAADGRHHAVRRLSWIPGRVLADVDCPSPTLLRSLGAALGEMHRAFEGFSHPEENRFLRWDLVHVDWVAAHSAAFDDAERSSLVEKCVLQYLAHVKTRIDELPRGFIHNDPNDHNILVDDNEEKVVGIIDMADTLVSCRIFEVAVAAAYAIHGRDDPLEAILDVTCGYHEVIPLTQPELEVLLPALCIRLCVSVTACRQNVARDPDNAYISVSEGPAWETLGKLASIDPHEARDSLLSACGFDTPTPEATVSGDEILAARTKHIGGSLSIAYKKPLHITRGWKQYLYDPAGHAHLDCVNNVCHVGHCHPKVVQAAREQIPELNTNTRYLHENLTHYAERLASLLPDPLEVCFFVNSGSEANELALRMARTVTGAKGVVVLGGGYHGNTSTLIDVSPYKHLRAGGKGPPDWVHTAPCPDDYRGLYKRDDPDCGKKYAEEVNRMAARARGSASGLAAFIAESLPGCGGQIVPPQGFLPEAFAHVRESGGICIADEVQVGFGRVGTHLWAFDALGAVPDIVTLGKPIGNGHPMAAVVTTRKIADTFDNGMEFFSTFGGNPVSCAIGMAVLDALEDDDLQQNALEVGEHLRVGLEELARHHEIIGDVRGLGLYIGVEMVRNRETLEPATDELSGIIERMRNQGILVSSDGPDENVLKIKPPLTFSHSDAELLLSVLDRALRD